MPFSKPEAPAPTPALLADGPEFEGVHEELKQLARAAEQEGREVLVEMIARLPPDIANSIKELALELPARFIRTQLGVYQLLTALECQARSHGFGVMGEENPGTSVH